MKVQYHCKIPIVRLTVVMVLGINILAALFSFGRFNAIQINVLRFFLLIASSDKRS